MQATAEPTNVNPKDAKIQQSRGMEAYNAGDHVTALKFFLEWANLDPNNSKARELIAEVLLKLGKKDEAIAMYKQVAKAYMDSGSIIKAIAVHKTLLSLDATDQEVKANLLSIFGDKLPEEISALLKPSAEAKSAKKEPGNITADDLGLAGLGEEDPLNQVFSDILGEDAELKAFLMPIGKDRHSAETFANTPLFSALKKPELAALIDKLNLVTFEKDQFICKEGEQSSVMWMIVQGEANVLTTNKKGETLFLATLSEGDFFGEGGFVTQAPRTASVRAKGPMKALEINKVDFDTASAEHPNMRDVLNRFYHFRLADRVLAQSEIFCSLPSFRRAELMQTFKIQIFKQGKILAKQGDVSKHLYLIKKGEVELMVVGEDNERSIGTLGPGEIFGDASLISGKPLVYSAFAMADTEVLTLSKIDVQGIVQMFPETEAIFSRRAKDLESKLAGK